MKKDWRYILYLTAVIGLYVTVQLSSKKENNWTLTLAHNDKEPYGTYVLNELLPSFLKNASITHSYKTVYEFKDSLKNQENIFILAAEFSGGKEDTRVLLDYAERGGNVFISANNFGGYFAEKLGLVLQDQAFENVLSESVKDSSQLHFTSTSLDSAQLYSYRRDNIHNYFKKVDSTVSTVISKNEKQHPVTIRMAKGKGQLILNCTPMAFTNIYMLAADNRDFVAQSLSYLPNRKMYWTEYYHLGRLEAQSPLRFVLTTEPLRWAYYLVLFSILIFMVFEARRKQRIIPVIKPLANTTLEFIATIGNLYFEKKDHKNIAGKKIQFFFDRVRSQYALATHTPDENFVTRLARKSGHTEKFIGELISLITKIQNSPSIHESELLALNSQLEKFAKGAFR